MSVLSAVRTYIQTYSSLATDAPVWVDYLSSDVVEYAIIPSPGPRILEEYIDGSTLRLFPFALQSMESTADNPTRIGNQEFYEAFSGWLESQTELGVLPVLGSGQTAVEIAADNWGHLFSEGPSDTAIYQIQCRLEYLQGA
jgi:hypothetical protein